MIKRRFKVFAGAHKNPVELDLLADSVSEAFWKAAHILSDYGMEIDVLWIKDDQNKIIWNADEDQVPEEKEIKLPTGINSATSTGAKQ